MVKLPKKAQAPEAIFPLSSLVDESERNRFILSYLPFIRKIAYKLGWMSSWEIPFEGLVNAGVVGLIDALNKYNPQKKVRFKTYAAYRVRGAILDELRSLDFLSRFYRQKATELEKTCQNLGKEKNGSVEDEEVAAALGLSLEAYYGMLTKVQVVWVPGEYPDSKPVQWDTEDPLGLIQKDQESDPLFILGKKELKANLARAINHLRAKENMVISLYYYEELTLMEIANILGFTESRICQIHRKAIRELRAGVRDFLSESVC